MFIYKHFIVFIKSAYFVFKKDDKLVRLKRNSNTNLFINNK